MSTDEFEMSIPIPPDADGMQGRECPDVDCSPGYFKVKPGTGITDGQTTAYCAYCRHAGDPSDFQTRAQVEYAKRIALNEFSDGIGRMIKDVFGLGTSGKKKLGDGFLSMEISYKPGPRTPVIPPREEELRRDAHCPHCGLDHAVFGLATWCPDCGEDIFLVHVEQEFSTVRKMLAAVETRRAELGARVAARDLENALEDTVSIFEAALKAATRRFLIGQGRTEPEVEDLFAKVIRTRYQSVRSAAEAFRTYTGADLLTGVSEADAQELEHAFEKRHPITHNLGVVDRKYLERVRSSELHGRELRVDVSEVERAIEIASAILRSAYERLFPSAGSPRGDG